jgi:hypothetical protein
MCGSVGSDGGFISMQGAGGSAEGNAPADEFWRFSRRNNFHIGARPRCGVENRRGRLGFLPRDVSLAFDVLCLVISYAAKS